MQAPGGGGGKGTSICKLFKLIVNFTYYSTCLLVKMYLIMQKIHDYYGVTNYSLTGVHWMDSVFGNASPSKK